MIRTDFTLNVNSAAFLPHLCLQRLTRYHWLHKADLWAGTELIFKKRKLTNLLDSQEKIEFLEYAVTAFVNPTSRNQKCKINTRLLAIDIVLI